MRRRGSGGSNSRRQSTLTASIVERRIDSHKIRHLCYKDIADHLHSHYPDYKHFKLIPFRNKIQQLLLQLNDTNNNNNSSRKRPGSGTAFFKDDDDDEEEGEGGEGCSPFRNKRRLVEDDDERERRLLEKEEDHLRRRADVLGAATTTSSVSSGAASTSSDEDAIYSEEAEPVFDLTKSLLMAKYSDTSLTPKSKQTPKLKSKIEGGDEERNVEVEDVRREKKLAGGAATLGVGGGEKGGSEVVEEGEVKGKGKEGVRFKDFGGIQEVINELIMEVIVPLYHPELPQWLGVKPMSGILLHGPPGCGKTRLAQAIANETDVPFYQISATEVVSGVSGASEENIRELFSKAYQTAPSIVFIDEIDAIASKRENLQREMERRIVTQLLTCMDESHRMVKVNNNNNSDTELDDKKSGYVLVIGATNRPDAVDAALRRPGRFDREIALGVPDEKSRAEILSLLTQKMRVAGDFDLNKIAKATPGFVGADLVALANKAGNLAMKRSIDLRRLDLSTEEELVEVHAQDWWKKSWPPEEMKKLSITMTDFEVAAKSVQPSSRREGFSTIPDVKWEDVGGLHDLRRQFTLYVVNRIKYATLYEESGVDLETGFLLYGPPGCGKTLIAKAVANEAGANFIHVKGPELLTKYVGESESHVRRIFSRARTCAPCIIFFDEVDALTTERGKEGGWVVERLLNQLLIELNGGAHRRGVYVIGATNRPDVMDHALLRPGRFGKLLFVPLPTADERGLILKALARKKPVDASVNFIELGERCENMSGADLSALVNEAAMAALEERLESATTVFGDSSSNIKPVHFEKALSKVKPSVSEERKRHYEKLSLTFRTA